MADNQIGIQFTGDASGLTKSINLVESQISRLAKLLKNPDLSFSQIERLSSLLKKSQAELNSFRKVAETASNSLGGKLANGSNQATFALTNLSRVAQDAPFGFIGIANNIEPLIGSFVALKKESGSTKAALSALGSSLLGGGGLVLAIGLASAAMSLFGQGMFKTKEKAEELEEGIRSSDKVISESSASTRGRVSELNILLGVVTNTTKSEKERLGALTRLKEIDKDLTEGITLQADSLKILTSRVNEYRDSLISAAIVAEFSSEIAKAAKEEDKQSRTFEDARTRVANATLALARAQKSTGRGAGSVVAGGADALSSDKIREATTELTDAKKQLREEEEKLFKIGVDRLNLENSLDAAILKQVKLIKERTKAGKEDNDTWDDATARKKFNELLRKSLSEFNTDIDLLNREFQSIGQKVNEKIAESFNAGASSGDSAAFKIKENLQASINKALSLGIEIPDLSFLSSDSAKKNIVDGLIEDFDKLNSNVRKTADIITNTLGSAFQNLFSDIISGSQNAFQSFASAIAQVITKLIAAAITAALLAAIIGAATGGTSFGAGAKNFIGGFKGIFSTLSGLPKFANGGIVTGPTLGLVGEAGREAIIPLDRIGEVLGSVGGAQSVFVTGQLSGETIYLQQQRTANRRGRFV